MERQRRRRRGFIRGLVRGCMWLVVLVALVAVCVLAVSAAVHIGDEPDNIAVAVEMPQDSIAVGETLTLTVTIDNLDLNAVTIVGIGLDTGLLNGVTVQSSEPAYRGTKERSYPLYGDWTEFRLSRTLADGETLPVTLTLEGVAPGIYTGDLTVWIEGEVLGFFPLDRAWRDTVEFEVR